LAEERLIRVQGARTSAATGKELKGSRLAGQGGRRRQGSNWERIESVTTSFCAFHLRGRGSNWERIERLRTAIAARWKIRVSSTIEAATGKELKVLDDEEGGSGGALR
jgi:hypothetical protein